MIQRGIITRTDPKSDLILAPELPSETGGNTPTNPTDPTGGNNGGDVPGSTPQDPLGIIAALLKQISDFLGSIVGFFDEAKKRIQNTATDVGAFVDWIDSPQTIERFGAIALGGVLVWIGFNAIVFSFTEPILEKAAPIVTKAAIAAL